MKPPFTLTITESQFTELYEHLFPGDGDEHGAVIAAGIAETPLRRVSSKLQVGPVC
jgi:hypothetical protein